MNKPWVWVLMCCITALIITTAAIVAAKWDDITYVEKHTCFNPSVRNDGRPGPTGEPWLYLPVEEPCPEGWSEIG